MKFKPLCWARKTSRQAQHHLHPLLSASLHTSGATVKTPEFSPLSPSGPLHMLSLLERLHSWVISFSHLSLRTLSASTIHHSFFISPWIIPPVSLLHFHGYSLCYIIKFLETRIKFLDFQISTGTQAGLNKCSLGTSARWKGSCPSCSPH